MTVVWHVDDLKLSHFDSFETTKFAWYLDKIYGALALKIGKVHNYLGVNQYLLTDGKVQVPMIHYLNKILRDLPEYLGTLSASPAANHLLKVRPEEEALPPPV